MGMFGRGACSACMRERGACICNRPTKITAKGVKPAKPRNPAAPRRASKSAPRTCGAMCRGASEPACASTVRGGVCPCPDC